MTKSSDTCQPSDSDGFALDGQASDKLDFSLEADSASIEAADDIAQTELQLPLENPEAPETEPQLELDGMAKPSFNILIDTGTESPESLSFRNAQTLLQSLEAQNVQIPFQCRDGYCGACRCQKISGEVTYIKEPMAWINDGEILPCISIPTSDLQLKLKH